jgi:hypothetical protein
MDVVSIDEQANTPSVGPARKPMATAVMVAAITALAMTSLGQSNVCAQAGDVMPAATPVAEVPLHIPLHSGEISRFAFGYIEFDWDPAGGVPGFGSWPLGTPQR